MTQAQIPKPGHAINGGGLVDRIWYDWFRQLAYLQATGALSSDAAIAAIASALGSPDGTVANIPPQEDTLAKVFAGTGINVTGNGTDAHPYIISLSADGVFVVTDTAAGFTTDDPTLSLGAIGWETDTGRFKFADGETAWTSLDYFNASALPYDNATSGLSATTTQAAIDEIAANASAQVFNRITADGDIRIDGNGDLRITN